MYVKTSGERVLKVAQEVGEYLILEDRSQVAVVDITEVTLGYYAWDKILQALHSGHQVFYDDIEVVNPTYENDWLKFSGCRMVKLNEETVKNLNAVQPLIGE
jgi:hypothetical protein